MILGIVIQPTTNILICYFLNDKLDKTIYMDQPSGFEDGLKRSLQQVPRKWNKKVVIPLKEFNLNHFENDACIFYKK